MSQLSLGQQLTVYVPPGQSGVPQYTRIVLDNRDARNTFYNQFVNRFYQELTSGVPKYTKELEQFYHHTLTIIFCSIGEGFKTYIDKVATDLDLSATIFADAIMANPLIRNTYYDASIAVALDVFFRLRTYGFLSNDNVYVLEQTQTDFIIIGIYPAHDPQVIYV